MVMSAQAEFDFEARKEEQRTASAAVLKRIKNLLRLGTNPAAARGEAETAMQMAYELAEKFRVDLAALDLDDETRRLIDERWPIGSRLDTLRRGVLNILQAFFHVTLCVSRPELIVIGKPGDVMIARYVHDFLIRAGRACLRHDEGSEKLHGRRMTPAKRIGFLQGFINGVASNLNRAKVQLALGDAHHALVLAEDRDREERLGELVPQRAALEDRKKHANKDALMRGYYAGRETQINQPLEGGKREAPLALGR